METLLKVRNVEKIYGGKGNLTKALDDVNFDVGKGEFLGIMGPSGSENNAFKLHLYHRYGNERPHCGKRYGYYYAEGRTACGIPAEAARVYFPGF